MKRREFVFGTTAVFFHAMSGLTLPLFSADPKRLPGYRIRTLTYGPKHHFFGYYGICPWNKSQTRLICLESAFQDHLPEPTEPANVGLVEPTSGEFIKVGETTAWNLQQGAMLHWNPMNPDDEIIFNDRYNEEPTAAILNVWTGSKRYLTRPVSAVSHNHGYALSLTYGRLARMRKVVGYVGAIDPNPNSKHPDNDGVFLIDLESGDTRLVVSIQEVYENAVAMHPVLRDRHMWFNHTVFNKDDSRFLFLARSRDENGDLDSAMYTIDIQGSDLRQVIPFGSRVSHFDWRNNQEIIATFSQSGKDDREHYLFLDGKTKYETVGQDFLFGDGHCTFSPDGNWFATDRNHYKEISKSLAIYNFESNAGLYLGMFPMKDMSNLRGNTRCDLHPRWNRTGDKICFDALDTRDWTRQLHVVELDFG